jgi:hypothetical protein
VIAMGAPPLYPALNASPSCYGGVTSLSGPGVGESGLGGFGVGACGCGRVVGVRGVGTLLGVGPGGCGTRCCLCAGLARFVAALCTRLLRSSGTAGFGASSLMAAPLQRLVGSP